MSNKRVFVNFCYLPKALKNLNFILKQTLAFIIRSCP